MSQRLSEAKREEIVELRKDGHTYKEIEEEADVSSWSVARTLKEAGLTGNQDNQDADPGEGDVDDLVPDADDTDASSGGLEDAVEKSCPYCNASIRVEPEDYPEFETPCCSKTVEVQA